MSAAVQDGKIIFNIPESAIGKELLITAQANEGFGLRNRPLSSIGVVRLQKSADGNKIFFNKERFEERITTGNSELRPAFEASNRQPLGIDYPVINNIDSERRKLVSTSNERLIPIIKGTSCRRHHYHI